MSQCQAMCKHNGKRCLRSAIKEKTRCSSHKFDEKKIQLYAVMDWNCWDHASDFNIIKIFTEFDQAQKFAKKYTENSLESMSDDEVEGGNAYKIGIVEYPADNVKGTAYAIMNKEHIGKIHMRSWDDFDYNLMNIIFVTKVENSIIS